MATPRFSVLVTAFNRADEIERCVRSALWDDAADIEVVVVDDASTDATLARLEALDEPRLRVVRHETNRGVSSARATGVRAATGEWLVLLDSDWELLPGSLEHLRQAIATLDPGVRIIRSRLRFDDGTISPVVIPDGVTDYRGRLRWLEAVTLNGGSSDAGHCIHRDVYAEGEHFHERHGIFESLWETDLARRERSLWLSDVLGLEHTDAANSMTRDSDLRRAVPRMISEAADIRWQVETMLDAHGAALAVDAPRHHAELLERAALESLLSGDRRAGLRFGVRALRAGARTPKLAATLALGLLDRRVLAATKAYGRGRRALTAGPGR